MGLLTPARLKISRLIYHYFEYLLTELPKLKEFTSAEEEAQAMDHKKGGISAAHLKGNNHVIR